MKVINLFAGPGAGKTTFAFELFSKMKRYNINVEMAPEYAKELVWEERYNTLKNQVYVLGKQMHRILRLNNKVDFVITDSPLLLSMIYRPEWLGITFDNIALHCFNSFDNINFFLKRNKPYKKAGRLETEEEAKKIDGNIKNMLKKNNIKHENIIGTSMGVDLAFNIIESNYLKN